MPTLKLVTIYSKNTQKCNEKVILKGIESYTNDCNKIISRF